MDMALRLNPKREVLPDGSPPASRPTNGPPLSTSHVRTDTDKAHMKLRLSLIRRKISFRLPPAGSHFYLTTGKGRASKGFAYNE